MGKDCEANELIPKGLSIVYKNISKLASPAPSDVVLLSMLYIRLMHSREEKDLSYNVQNVMQTTQDGCVKSTF